MTLGNVLSQMGVGTKHVADSRYSDYHSAPSHEQHIYYAYEPHHSWKQHSYHGKKNHAAMSALTLLAFLFFLHILQQCLRDHMQSMQQIPQVMIMTAGREGEDDIASDKIDKSGISTDDDKNHNDENKLPNPLEKIKTAQHVPIFESYRYKNLYRDYVNKTSLPTFVTSGEN